MFLDFLNGGMYGFSMAFPEFAGTKHGSLLPFPSALRFEGHIAISELQHFPLEVDGSATLRVEG